MKNPVYPGAVIREDCLEKLRVEACWVLFRFLYWGQLADPCLIIHIDDVGWSVVSERFV